MPLMLDSNLRKLIPYDTDNRLNPAGWKMHCDGGAAIYESLREG